MSAKGKTTRALTRDQILGLDDRPREKLWVPEWKTHVWVTVMTGAGLDTWEQRFYGDEREKHLPHVRATLVALTAVGEDGTPLFTLDDVPALAQKSSKALDRIFEKAFALNRLKAEDLGALEKNS